VELLSDDASLELKDLMGRLVCVELVREDGSLRYFSGHVFAFRLVRTDGAVAFYEAVLAPWLAYLKLRKNNFLFHGKTLRQQTEAIFADYGVLPSWDCRIAGDDPSMTDACQFDESDHNYLHRRWEAAGWSYWYEHDATGHKLILCDDTTSTAAVDGDASVPFQRHGGAVEEDGIGEWSPARRLVEGATAVAGFDFKQPVPKYAQMPTLNRQGGVPAIESYEYAGAYPFADRAQAEATARLRMEEIEARGKHFTGAGNCRRLQPGRWFELTGHFDDPYDADRNHFVVVEVVHEASNNYLHARGEGPAPVAYRNRVQCLRRSIQFRVGTRGNIVGRRRTGPGRRAPRGFGSDHPMAGRVARPPHRDRHRIQRRRRDRR